MDHWIKPAFTVIGIEGSTNDGPGFIQRLWEQANGRFAEVAALAKTGPDGSLCGIWGAMSDMSRRFMPWEDGFTRGLYLAGVECRDGAEPPAGWTRWQARCTILQTRQRVGDICSFPSADWTGNNERKHFI